jgi:hypothetical protein
MKKNMPPKVGHKTPTLGGIYLLRFIINALAVCLTLKIERIDNHQEVEFALLLKSKRFCPSF